MKNYYFDDSCGKRHYVTGLRGSWQYVNFDMPDVYDRKGNKVIEVCFPSYEITILNYNTEEGYLLSQFIDLSDRAFCKHFAEKEWCDTYEGKLKSRIVLYD